MKTTKNLLKVFLGLMLALGVTACSDDVVIRGDVSMPENTDLMKLDAWSYEIPFEVKTDSKWRIETTGDLCYAFPEEGTGDATVKLCIIDNATEERQTGELRVIFPEDESKNKVYKLEQKCEADYGDNAVSLVTGNRVYAVGFGYDATNMYANPEAVKNPILKFAFMAENELIVRGTTDATIKRSTYTGSSVTDISNKLAANAGVSGSYGGFKGEIAISFERSDMQSNTNEFALTYLNMVLMPVYCEAGLEEIRTDYMTLPAYKAINGLSRTYPSTSEGFKKLIQDYGTHLLTRAKLGGRVRHSLTVDISKITSAYDIGAFAAASYSNAFVDASASVDENFKKSYETNKKNCKEELSILGGDMKLAQELSNNFNKTNLDAWANSVNEDAMALVGFEDPENSLIPLYELVDSVNYPERYDLLRKYMEGAAFAKDFPSLTAEYDCGTVTRIKVPDFKKGSLVKEIKIDGQVVGQVCEEFIPVLNKDARVKVVYPVVNNIARYNMGYFLGNASHRPCRVSWDGTKVTLNEFAEESFGEQETLYIKGSNISRTTELPAEDIVDGTVVDATMTGLKDVNIYEYPLVKIFDKIWTMEDYQGIKKNDGGMLNSDQKWYHDGYKKWYFRASAAADKLWAPAGWRVASSADYKTIQDQMVANGFSAPALPFLPGKQLGFNAEFKGWYDIYYRRFVDSSDQTEYWTSEGNQHVRIRKDGSFAVEPLSDNYYMSVRMVKK